MFERGRIDHLGFQAASLDAFAEIRRRLIGSSSSDGFVTDFGLVLSIFFRDPDGLEGEVCVANPDAQPGVFNPPGNAICLLRRLNACSQVRSHTLSEDDLLAFPEA